MTSLEYWINKYSNYVDFNIFQVIDIGIYKIRHRKTRYYSFGDMQRKDIDMEKHLNPTVVLLGCSWMQYVVEYVDVHGESEARKAKRIKSGKIKDSLVPPDVNHVLEFEECLRSIDNDEHIKYVAQVYGTSDSNPDYGPDLPEWSTIEYIEDNLDALENVESDVLIWTDNRFFIETSQYFEEASKTNSFISLNDFLNFTYRYIQDSFWYGIPEELTLNNLSEKYTNIRQKLSEKVICQDAAIRKFVRGLFTGEMREGSSKNSPVATFLFVGPPGVGKTFLAKSVAPLLERECKVFQMNEYASKDSYHDLVGFARTYKDSQSGELTGYVNTHPNAVLIFDEIEKANVTTIRQFLSILEGGFLRDLYTEEDVDFTNTIVIFTTNAGRDFYEEKRNMSISAIPEATIIDALKKDKNEEGQPIMPTEILSRMAKGNIIGFDHMNPAKLIPIIKRGMIEGKAIVEDKLNISCEFNESLLPYLFLFHLGSELDARVASTRSKSFITDSIFNVVERMGSNPEKYSDHDIQRVRYEVEEESLSREYTVIPDKMNLILVSYRNDRALMLPERTDAYHLFYAWDQQDEEGKQIGISNLIAEHNIDAIIIDPFMRGRMTEDSPENLEGLIHQHTHGNNVLKWILAQNNMPPVYVMECHNHISLVDQLELQNAGIAGILDMVDKDHEKCRKLLNDMVYELFLTSKIDTLIRKGRCLDFEIGENLVDDCIEIVCHNFKLITNMTTDATDIVVNDLDKPSLSFDDVIGAEVAKEELRKFMRYLINPKEYMRSGMQISRGILLYGPPGMGKTILAKALAAEADCPFIATTGAQFVDGSKNISKIFALARKYSPSVIFIDEIDSFAMNRSDTDSQRATLVNNLLTEMDGFDSDFSQPVFVIAATNAASAPGLGGNNIYLDPALQRRFSKKVFVDLPNMDERLTYLLKMKDKLSNKMYNLNELSENQLEHLARNSVGHSLAELENVINLAIGRGVEEGTPVSEEILINCFEESVFGEKMSVSEEHLFTTALHEAGHAYLGFHSGERFYPEYATIIARGGYLGMVQTSTEENCGGYSRKELLARIRIKLAGRAAEIVFNGPDKGLTTGASNDLETATMMASSLLTTYGMEEGFLPVVDHKLMMTSSLAEKYYNHLNEILIDQLKESIRIIEEHKSAIETLAKSLIRYSRLNTEDMKKILDV